MKICKLKLKHIENVKAIIHILLLNGYSTNIRGTYRTISFAVSAVVKIQEKGVDIIGLFD